MVIKIKKLNIYTIFWFYIWNVDTLVAYFRAAMVRIPFIGQYVFIPFAVFHISLMFFSLPYIKKYIKWKDILGFAVFTIAYILSCMINNKTRNYLLDNIFQVLILTVPLYFLGLSFDEKRQEVLSMMKITSLISIPLHFLFVLAVGVGNITQVEDNMSYAYRILPHICLCFAVFVNEKKKTYLFASLAGLLLIFFFGSRGCSLLGFSFMVVYFVFFREKKNIKISLGISAIGLVLIVFYEKILLFLNNLFNKLGYNTRIFQQLLSGWFFTSYGRDEIRIEAIELIKQNPVWGYGIAGDRQLMIADYAHNFILEMLLSFGVVAGTLGILCIVIYLIRAVFISKNMDYRTIILVLVFGNGFLKLFLSGTYLLEYQFFLLLGICVSAVRRRKHYKKYEVLSLL